jgi:hypothetical protein
MSNTTVQFLITGFVVLWTVYAFFRFIPESAKGQKFFYKLVQFLSYATFSAFFGYLFFATELKNEDFFKFEWKYLIVIFGTCTLIMGLRWLIETFRTSR